MDQNFLKTHAARCRQLAEGADEFTRKRLLDLAAVYESRLETSTAATRMIKNSAAANGSRQDR